MGAMGEMGILNVGAGDIKLSFNKDDMVERLRAARIVTDMIRRGYVLIIDTGDGKYQRVQEFKEDVCEYIIADGAEQAASVEEPLEEQKSATKDKAVKKGRKGKTRSIPAEKTHGVAVARTAGG